MRMIQSRLHGAYITLPRAPPPSGPVREQPTGREPGQTVRQRRQIYSTKSGEACMTSHFSLKFRSAACLVAGAALCTLAWPVDGKAIDGFAVSVVSRSGQQNWQTFAAEGVFTGAKF
jgi:hypothetical protein